MRCLILLLVFLSTPIRLAAFEPNGILVFMTDFGVEDDAVAICKGVMFTRDPDIRVVDLTHDVTPFDIREGALYLGETAGEYPPGTVFVGVVDPGVGTTRRAIVLESETGKAFVAPDNGLLSVVANAEGVRGAWEITNPVFMRPDASSTFHGRDLFSPAGAVLAAGQAAPKDAGAPVDSIARLVLPTAWIKNGIVFGEVLILDKSFGNVWTNIGRSRLEEAFGANPARLEISFGEIVLSMPFTSTFGNVPVGAPLAYINSRDNLAFALNMGNFGEQYDMFPGTLIAVKKE